MNLIGGFLMYLLNSIIMTLPFVFLYLAYKLLEINYLKIFIIIIFWLSIEFLQEKLEFGCPIFTIGNVFSMYPILIQWYEYTGVAGGTLWVIIVNFLLFIIIKEYQFKRNKIILRVAVLILFFFVYIPLILSFYLFKNYNEESKSIEVVVVHPNINCYTQKYNGILSIEEQINNHINLTKSHLSLSTEYAIWPETAIPNMDWIELIDNNKDIKIIKDLIKEFPNLKVITGAIGFELFKEGKVLPKEYEKFDIKFNNKFKVWYYTYNMAVQIDSTKNIPVHIKQKLVPFEERTPYPIIFNNVQSCIGSLGNFGFAKSEKNVHFISNNNMKILPLICYESIFSDYTAKSSNSVNQM